MPRKIKRKANIIMDIKKVESQKTIKDKIKSLKKTKTSESGKVKAPKSQFQDKLLEAAEVKEVHMELDRLLEKIDEIGKKFSHKPDLENLQEYKSLIKAFMTMVIEKMYRVKEKMGHRSWVKQKIYITIEKIDTKLEQLTQFVLDKENFNINLLATLDEIRGLLIDLYK